MDGMEYQDSFDMDLCKVCGKRHIDRSTGRVGEFMCRECRAEYSKLKVPKWLIACIALVCTVALAMIVYLGRLHGNYTVGTKAKAAGNDVIERAEELIAEHKQWSALDEIYYYLEENPSNADVAIEGMRIAMDTGMYDYAAFFENQYLLDKGFTDYELKEIYEYNDIINKYYDTNDAISAVLNTFSGSDAQNMSQEEIDKLVEEMQGKLLELLKDEQYESGPIYYALAFYFPYDLDEAEKFLKKAQAYKPYAADSAALLARLERAHGDFGAADAWIKKGEETNGENTELVRVKATILLAKGEYDKAVTMMEALYSVAPEYRYVADTYAVSLYAVGNIEEMNRIISEAESTGYEFDEEFHALINGELSVYDYYVEGEE